MAETVAFIFSDLAGSTGLLAEMGPTAYAELLAEYRGAVGQAVEAEGGHLVDREGDGLFLVLPTAAGALRAAAVAQRRLSHSDRPGHSGITVRMGIHVGEVHPRADEYVGLDINRAARIGALAHGGQVLVSEAAKLLGASAIGGTLKLRELGAYRLKGFEEPERLHQLLAPDIPDEFPPLDPLADASRERLEHARAVAVLPFETVGDSQDARFLAAGLHNDLINALSRIPELTVISRTSVLGYGDTDKSIPQIARELNAGTLIEGALQCVASRVRLTVQLVDGIDDVHRWAESYDRELTTADLFAVQTELTTQIAESLNTELTRDVPAIRGRPPTPDLEAYRLAAEGRQHVDLRTRDGFLQAIELFERAIERDSGYVAAWVGLADALTLMEDYSFGHTEELLVRADRAGRRALELDPSAAAAHASLGLIHIARQDGPASTRELEHAIRLQPSHADAHSWHSWVSLLTGRARPGLESAMRAVQLDPRSAEPINHLSLGYTAIGDPGRGTDEAQRARRLSSAFTTAAFYEGIAHYEAGSYEEAFATLEPLTVVAGGELSVPWAGYGPDATLALALVGLHRIEDARRVLRTIDIERDPFAAGLGRLAVGDSDEAVTAFAGIDEMTPWPCLAVHHFYAEVWARIAGTDIYRELVRSAYCSWKMEPDGG